VALSVWHPDGVALRMQLFGKRRHPINVIATERGELFIEEGLVYNNPELEVVILTGDLGQSRLAPRLGHRTWVHVERTGELPDLRRGFTILRQKYGVVFASAVGGPRVATELLDSNLVQDLYLTTTPIVVVPPTPPTPFYLGDPVRLRQSMDLVVRKGTETPDGSIHSDYYRVSMG
jgi:riboflavin biosynthesis pyrimidine reductase